MKKRIGYVLAILVLVCLFGCGGTEQISKEQPEREQLVLWSYYETSAQRAGLDQLVEEFNKSQQQYEISWEYIPMADFTKELSVAFSGSALPDLILVDNPDTQSMIRGGLLEDLTDQLGDDMVESDYYQEVWTTVMDGKRCYGVPFCCNNTAIIYNRTMFEEAGVEPPHTWEEFEWAAQRLTDLKSGRYGFAMSAASGEQGAFQFMPWILSAVDGQDPVEETSIEAFKRIDRMLSNGSMPNDCMNWSQNDVTKMFVSGKLAMMENGPWAFPEMEEAGIDFGMVPFPGSKEKKVVIGGENLAVIKGKNVNGSIAFIRYYNQEKVMEEISVITRNIPPKIEAARKFGEEHASYQVFVDQMEDGISRNSVQNWKQVCRALSDSLYQLFGSDRSTEEIWKKYERSMKRE